MAMDRNAEAQSCEEGPGVGDAAGVRDPYVSALSEHLEAQGSVGENLLFDTAGVSVGVEGASVV
jgi:hypothetical protein